MYILKTMSKSIIFSVYLVIVLIEFSQNKEMTEKEIAQAIKAYCVGKTRNFCSQEQLRFSMSILHEQEMVKKVEKERKAQQETSLLTKYRIERNTEIRREMQQQIKNKILKEIKEYFIMRYF